jgi:pimeloyl-ACP methyl ester carboxylesterase
MLFLIFAFLLFVVYVNAEDCRKCTPGNFTGTLLGAAYEIKVPANFNGILVLYARGYSADVPAAEAFFGGDDFEAPLLNAGYALAGSNYGASGWAVREGLLTTTALRLVYMKVAPRCWPKKVILYGSGMGGVVALAMAEKLPKCLPLSAVVAGCTPAAGTTRTFDAAAGYNLAFAAFNGGFPWGDPNNITDGLSYSATVQPKVTQMLVTPSFMEKLEFQRVIMNLPNNLYYALPNAGVYQNYFYSTQALMELEQRAGGAVAQNPAVTYSLTTAQRALLISAGMSSSEINTNLLYMNTHRYNANATARAYMAKYADFTGQLSVPVITLHGIYDTLVPVTAEAAYAATVSTAGKSSMLFQTYTTAAGHCTFTPDQLFLAISSAVKWASGTAPVAGDFPSSEGFNSSYVPAAWPYF